MYYAFFDTVCQEFSLCPADIPPYPHSMRDNRSRTGFSVLCFVSFTFTRHSHSTGEKKIPVKTEWMGKRSLHFIQNQIAFQNREAKWQRNQVAS